MIRKAEPRDKADVVKLEYMSAPSLRRYLWACDESRVLKLLDCLYDTADTITSRDFFWVDDENGEVKGAISVLPARDKMALERNFSEHGADVMRIAGPVSYVKMMLHNSSLTSHLPELSDDELYVQAVAVYPDTSEQTASTALFKHAFDYARNLNLPKVSLLAETTNEHMISMCQKHGFAITRTIFLQAKYRRYSLYGTHKMVAEVR